MNHSANLTFARLPTLEKIEVENYSLFTKSWTYVLKPGLNLFVGANGVGKTTTTNLIIAGIIGFQDGFDSDYFKSRSKDTVAKEKLSEEPNSPLLTVHFKIGPHSFQVKRNIIFSAINELKVDDQIYTSDSVDNLDDHYEGLLKEYTGIGTLEDLAFLLQLFLIRVEEGNYLLWDNKGGDQSKLIRLLINNVGFEEEYKRLARIVKDLDTKLRGTQDTRYQVVKRKEILLEERVKSLESKKGYKEFKDLEKDLKLKEDHLETLNQTLERILTQIKEARDDLNTHNIQYHSVSLDFEKIGEEATILENQLYDYVYSDEKVLSAIHKLKYYNRCIYCDSIPKSNIRQKIINSVEHECQCPVCNSKIDGLKTTKLNDEEAHIERLESLKRKAAELGQKRGQLKSSIETKESMLKSQFQRKDELSLKAHILAVDIFDLKLQISNLNRNPEDKVTGLDSQIQALNNEIKAYDQQIIPLKKSYEEAYEKLESKNNLQEEVLNAFESELNEIFVKYASKYFKRDCQLVTSIRKPKDSNVMIKSFVPELDGLMRWSSSKCSTSQRIFLEYLFRISLLELYQKKTGNNGFMILETSEGAFDITNTKQLAKALSEFGKQKIPFVIISNFSKKDFLEEVAQGLGSSKKDRVLNFINFSHLTDVQSEDLPDYHKIMKEIGLE